MMQKLRVLPIGCAHQCPFYVKDTAGAAYCFVKATTSARIATALMEDASHYDVSSWTQDCQGSYDNCSIIPLLWAFDEETDEQPNGAADKEPARAVAVDSDIEDYDPFAPEEEPKEEPEEEDGEEDEGGAEEPPKSALAPQVDEPESRNEDPGNDQGNDQGSDRDNDEVTEPSVRVSIHQVANPYAVKCDLLVYPTNIVLTVDDPLLNRLSRGVIQQECDATPRPIRMGHVYATSNGGEHSGVKAKAVLQAVVAGPSRLVNESDVNSAMMKALILAESVQAETVVVLPFDCGTHDLNNIARVQLAAVNKFLKTHETKSLKHVFFVAEDEDSIEVFEEYFDRIFEV